MYRRLITIILFVAAFLCAPGFLSETYAQNYNRYEDSYNFTRAVEALRDGNEAEAVNFLDKEVSLHKDNSYAYSLLQYVYHNRQQYGVTYES